VIVKKISKKRVTSNKCAMVRESKRFNDDSGGGMKTVEERERIRRAYYIEGKSMRQIAVELRHSYWTVRSALADAEVRPYTLRVAKRAPVLGPYKDQVNALVVESEQQPRKQRYTSHKIYELLRQAGYAGSESSVRHYVSQRRKGRKRPAIYLPLSYEPGKDAQVDFGEALVILAGERVAVQLFVMRLCYSRKLFVMAFPSQRQEAFFWGHVQAFHYFGGVPQRLTYDNLKVAVRKILEGRNRQEQTAFTTLRSHYLFESRFCTPRPVGTRGHEKGGVESGVGYTQRNFLTPLLEVTNFGELNERLLVACQADDVRCVDRQPQPIGAMWATERPLLRTLPPDFVCCTSQEVTLNPYGQVVFETNRYSVPVQLAQKHLVLKAYPFQIEIVSAGQVIARHERCYGRQQDVLEPLHYLPLLVERPGAFEHAIPMRQWRAQWPPIYETLLSRLQQQWPEGRGVREFLTILQLHQSHAAQQVEQAIHQALAHHCAHAAGVQLCLTQAQASTPVAPILDLHSHPQLLGIGEQAVNLAQYDLLVRRSA
jgi:transposase